jgi:hypothetical protein
MPSDTLMFLETDILGLLASVRPSIHPLELFEYANFGSVLSCMLFARCIYHTMFSLFSRSVHIWYTVL